MKTQLIATLNRIGVNFVENWYEIRDIQEWMMDEIFRKRKTLPYFRKKVLFSFLSWQKNHPVRPSLFLFEKDAEELAIYFRYFYKKLDWLFRYFIEKIFVGFDEKRLELRGIEGGFLRNSDLLFEYVYHLSVEEINTFEEFRQKFHHPDHSYRIISYTFNIITTVFNQILKNIIKNKLHILMGCGEVHAEAENTSYLHFLLIVRSIDRNFVTAYLNTLIYHFSELVPNVDRVFLRRLNRKHEEIYPFAVAQYPQSKRNFPVVLYTLQRKAQTIKQITPLLDILNFIVSRVEDSIYDVQDLVRKIIQEKIINSESREFQADIYDIFFFINSAASLFSTFQANNRASILHQYQLYFFYCQYFFGNSLSMMHRNMSIYFPEKFRSGLETMQQSTKTLEQGFRTLSNLFFQGLSLPPDGVFERIFHILFNDNVNHINETFFDSFLYSLNQKFQNLIEFYHQKYQRRDISFPYDFNGIIHEICVILYNLASQIFFRKSVQEATHVFRDKLTRYTSEEIALRVLELQIFKDIPLSDNNWQDYYLSRNKKMVQKKTKPYFTIPEGNFFTSERLLKINMMYERGFLQNSMFLEEWMISKIFVPFLSFYNRIQQQLPSEFTRQHLFNIIYKEFSTGLMDPAILERLDDVAEFFTSIWQGNLK